MPHTSFTLAEAEEMREDFEDLKDTEFGLGVAGIYFVQDIVVCPFGETDKSGFIDRYNESKNGHDALSAYDGSDYDVMLITCNTMDDTQCIYLDIRTFADKNGIKYNFP